MRYPNRVAIFSQEFAPADRNLAGLPIRGAASGLRPQAVDG